MLLLLTWGYRKSWSFSYLCLPPKLNEINHKWGFGKDVVGMDKAIKSLESCLTLWNRDSQRPRSWKTEELADMGYLKSWYGVYKRLESLLHMPIPPPRLTRIKHKWGFRKDVVETDKAIKSLGSCITLWNWASHQPRLRKTKELADMGYIKVLYWVCKQLETSFISLPNSQLDWNQKQVGLC